MTVRGTNKKYTDYDIVAYSYHTVLGEKPNCSRRQCLYDKRQSWAILVRIALGVKGTLECSCITKEEMTKTAGSSVARADSRAPLAKAIEPSQESRNEDDDIVLNSSSEWEQYFQRLLSYKAEHGDTLVPNRYPSDPSLGHWGELQSKIFRCLHLWVLKESETCACIDCEYLPLVKMMRRQYRIQQSGVMQSRTIDQQIQRLQDIDFRWTTRDSTHVRWDSRYLELVDFSRRFGHSQVPVRWKVCTQLCVRYVGIDFHRNIRSLASC